MLKISHCWTPCSGRFDKKRAEILLRAPLGIKWIFPRRHVCACAHVYVYVHKEDPWNSLNVELCTAFDWSLNYQPNQADLAQFYEVRIVRSGSKWNTFKNLFGSKIHIFTGIQLYASAYYCFCFFWLKTLLVCKALKLAIWNLTRLPQNFLCLPCHQISCTPVQN